MRVTRDAGQGLRGAENATRYHRHFRLVGVLRILGDVLILYVHELCS